jgi:polar amino acid transport system substrate-binding protein
MFEASARHCLPGLLLLAALFTPAALAGDLSTALERGTLRIGVSLFTPWTMRGENGELTGFEIDVGRQLAQDMGLEAEFSVHEWEQITDHLLAGEIDLIAAGMAITPERALKVEFSDPYAASGVTLLAHTANTESVSRLADLDQADYTIASVTDTLGDNVAEQVFTTAERRRFATSAAAEQALLAGDVDAYVVSAPEARFLAFEHPDTLDIPLGEPLIVVQAGFAVAPGEQRLLNFLDAWITHRRASRWLEAVHERWFATTSWMDRTDGR